MLKIKKFYMPTLSFLLILLHISKILSNFAPDKT